MILRPLAVNGLGVVPAAAGEVPRGGMLGPGQGAVTNAVAVYVAVALEAAEPAQVFRAEHLAPRNRFFGIRKSVRHPIVHAQVEVAHDEDRRLEFFRQVKSLDRHRVTLLNRGREQQDVLGVAVGENGGREDVALGGPRGQARRRSHALDVENHGRHFRVVAETDELRHQRDTRPGGGGHGARARPSRPDHHTDGGQLVFSLDDRERRFPGFGVHPVALHVADQRLAERRGRSDRIPRHHRDAGKHAAQRRGRITVNQNFAARQVHALDGITIGLFQALRREIVARHHGLEIQVRRLRFLLKLLAQRLLDLLHVDAEQSCDHPDVDHVADELAQFGVRADRRHDLVKRDRVENQVAAQAPQVERLVVDDRRARLEASHVFFRGFRIHRHQEVDLLAPRDVTVLRGANREPGGQAGNIRGKQVLAGDGYPHLKDRPQEHAVGALAAGAVDGCDLDAQVVHHTLPLGLHRLFTYRDIRGCHYRPSLLLNVTFLRSALRFFTLGYWINVSSPSSGFVYFVAIKASTRSARSISVTSVLKAPKSPRESLWLRPTVAPRPCRNPPRRDQPCAPRVMSRSTHAIHYIRTRKSGLKYKSEGLSVRQSVEFMMRLSVFSYQFSVRTVEIRKSKARGQGPFDF